MIYFIYAQYRNHWLKITQERSECDLMTNSVKFMQQTGQGVHHCQKVTVVFVININLMHSTYLINSLKVKASVENVHLWYKHKLAEVYAIHWYELHQWLSAADHVTLQSSTSSIRWHHGSFSEHWCIVFHRIQTWAIKVASYLARWIMRSHMQYAVEIGSNWFSSFTR